jgi:hypothetical protein
MNTRFFSILIALLLLVSVCFLPSEAAPPKSVWNSPLISIPTQKMDLDAWLQSIQTQTSNAWKWKTASNPVFNHPGIEKRDFWNEMFDRCSQLGLYPEAVEEGKSIQFVPRRINKIYRSIHQQAVVEIMAIRSEKKVNFSEVPRTEFELQIRLEPWMELYRVGKAVGEIQIKDGVKIISLPGSSLIPGRGAIGSVSMSFEGIAREIVGIPTLKGEIHITAAVGMRDFRLSLSQPDEKVQEGVQVKFLGSKSLGKVVKLEFELTYPSDFPDFESFEIDWLSRNRLQLVGPNQESIPIEKMELNGKRLAYFLSKELWPGEPKKWSIRYTAPVQFRDAVVPFVFENCPLP